MVTQLSTLTWNISGVKNIYNLDSKIIDYISKVGIIGFIETWHSKDIQINWLKNYYSLDSKAVKSNSLKGRPSGGLMLFFSKKDFINIVDYKIEKKLHSNCSGRQIS